jgi:phytoene/squalene synthetase
MSPSRSLGRKQLEELGAIPGTLDFYRYRFAPLEIRDQLLVLQALTGEIRAVIRKVSDPGVALAKLGWWQQELLEPARSRSQHPIVCSANSVDLFRRVEDAAVQGLVLACARLAQFESMPDWDVVRSACGEIGSNEISLVTALEEKPLSADVETQLGTALMLERFSVSLDASLPGGGWWVPLQEQARLGLSIADVRAGRNLAAVQKLLSTLGVEILKQLRQARMGINTREGGAGQVIRVTYSLLERRARRISSHASSVHRGPSLAELGTAWWAAMKPW